MSTEMRKFPQFLALAVALGGSLALAACQPTGQSADTAASSGAEQTPPPAEPTPSAPSDVSGGGTTAPAADAANTAPPTDAGAMPPASEPTAPPASDADKAKTEEPKPADQAKPEENK